MVARGTPDSHFKTIDEVKLMRFFVRFLSVAYTFDYAVMRVAMRVNPLKRRCAENDEGAGRVLCFWLSGITCVEIIWWLQHTVHTVDYDDSMELYVLL